MKQPVAKGRRVLEWLAPWVAVSAGVLFIPIALWELVIAVCGTPGGFVYFGHNPEYVFPGNHFEGYNYFVREVGGGAWWWVPVDLPAMVATGVLIAYAVLAGAMMIAADVARWRVRLGVEKRWLTRAAEGVCPECGYDVRATPARCPECGCAVRMKERAYRRLVGRRCRRWAIPNADLLLRHLARLVL